MKNKIRQFIIAAVVVLTVFCLVFIFGNSLKDSSESSEQSMAVKEILVAMAGMLGIDGDINVAVLRNLAHVAEFALLGVCLGALALYLARRRAPVSVARYSVFLSSAFAVGLLVAVFDELLQLGSAGRACELKDVILDTLGILAGTLLSSLTYFLIVRIRKVREEKKKDKI